MKYQQANDDFFVYVEKDEPVMETLTDFCQTHNISNGMITGIGAVKDIELGVFVVETASYHTETFPDTYELTNFIGNITLKDGIPFIHAHIVLGQHDFQTISGHCFAMKVAVVGEFIIRKINTSVARAMDPEIGLATWTMEEDHE